MENHAPLMMPEMLFLYQFQNRFGHHKWCTIFSINRMVCTTGITLSKRTYEYEYIVKLKIKK